MTVDSDAVASVTGITTSYKAPTSTAGKHLPQQVGVIGQGASATTYAVTPFVATSSDAVGQKTGFGGPLHLAATKLLPKNGDGLSSVTFFPMQDAGSGVAAAGDITPSGTALAAAEYRIKCGSFVSQAFVVAAGAVVPATVINAMIDATNAVLEMPIIAADGTTEMTTTVKWAGASGNSVELEVIGPADNGVVFAITQPAGGLVNPDVDDVLTAIGSTWYTMLLNCLEVSDDTTLDKYQVWGEGRWGTLVKAPCMVFSGEVEADRATATTLTDSRKDDRVNVQVPFPGALEIPFVAAARALARIAKVANNNPPMDYNGLVVDQVDGGTTEWLYADRDLALKAGSSTVELANSKVVLADIVTMYHPVGESPPAYSKVSSIVRLQNIIFRLRLKFEAQEWAGAPMVPDDQPVDSSSKAKKPYMAAAEVEGIIDGLGVDAIISDPERAKELITVEIDGANANRINVVVPPQLSGNTSIKDIALNFSFYTGGAAA